MVHPPSAPGRSTARGPPHTRPSRCPPPLLPLPPPMPPAPTLPTPSPPTPPQTAPTAHNPWPTDAHTSPCSSAPPTASASGDATTIYSSGLNTGYQLVLPADTQQRTVSFFGGVYGATGQLTATLSDGSATPYVATLDNPSTNSVFDVYTITYQAGSAGQTLTLNLVQTNMYVSARDF